MSASTPIYTSDYNLAFPGTIGTNIGSSTFQSTIPSSAVGSSQGIYQYLDTSHDANIIAMSGLSTEPVIKLSCLNSTDSAPSHIATFGSSGSELFSDVIIDGRMTSTTATIGSATITSLSLGSGTDSGTFSCGGLTASSVTSTGNITAPTATITSLSVGSEVDAGTLSAGSLTVLGSSTLTGGATTTSSTVINQALPGVTVYGTSPGSYWVEFSQDITIAPYYMIPGVSTNQIKVSQNGTFLTTGTTYYATLTSSGRFEIRATTSLSDPTISPAGLPTGVVGIFIFIKPGLTFTSSFQPTSISVSGDAGTTTITATSVTTGSIICSSETDSGTLSAGPSTFNGRMTSFANGSYWGVATTTNLATQKNGTFILIPQVFIGDTSVMSCNFSTGALQTTSTGVYQWSATVTFSGAGANMPSNPSLLFTDATTTKTTMTYNMPLTNSGYSMSLTGIFTMAANSPYYIKYTLPLTWTGAAGTIQLCLSINRVI